MVEKAPFYLSTTFLATFKSEQSYHSLFYLHFLKGTHSLQDHSELHWHGMQALEALDPSPTFSNLMLCIPALMVCDSFNTFCLSFLLPHIVILLSALSECSLLNKMPGRLPSTLLQISVSKRFPSYIKVSLTPHSSCSSTVRCCFPCDLSSPYVHFHYRSHERVYF